MRYPGKRFAPNKLRKWPEAAGSFIVMEAKAQAPNPLPPADQGYILQENRFVILAENGAKLLRESAA